MSPTYVLIMYIALNEALGRAIKAVNIGAYTQACYKGHRPFSFFKEYSVFCLSSIQKTLTPIV